MERFSAAGVHVPATHAQVVLAGSTLYLAGQLSLDADGQPFGSDCGQQSEHIWQQIGTILNEAGADYSDVFRVVTYLTDIADRDVAVRVRQTYLGDHLPASTVVGVASLEQPGLKIEIEVTARRPAPPRHTDVTG